MSKPCKGCEKEQPEGSYFSAWCLDCEKQDPFTISRLRDYRKNWEWYQTPRELENRRTYLEALGKAMGHTRMGQWQEFAPPPYPECDIPSMMKEHRPPFIQMSGRCMGCLQFVTVTGMGWSDEYLLRHVPCADIRKTYAFTCGSCGHGTEKKE